MKCFYHNSDLDGFCSGAIVKYKYPDCKLIGIDYGDRFPWKILSDNEEVFMVDFSLQPYSDMLKLNEMVDLTWIDHHKSAIEEHKKMPLREADTILNTSLAACELAWHLIFNTTLIPKAVHWLGRYDVWDHKEVQTLPFQYGMRLRADDPCDNMTFWKSVFENFPEDILLEGQTVLDYVENHNSKYIRATGFKTELDGLRCIAANSQLTNSQLFDTIWDNKRYDAMLTFGWKKGQWTVTLYSDKKDIDVSKIAKARGGRGHKGAAGFQCKELPFELG